MSHQSASSYPTMDQRRSSTVSEKTLVDTPSHQVRASEDQMSSDTRSTRSRGSTSSIPSIMDKAAKKVKSKLGSKGSASEPKPKPKPQQPAGDSYPDTVYMWRALAETRI